VRQKTIVTLTLLALFSTPAWACGTGAGGGIFLLILAGLLLAYAIFIPLALAPAFILASKSKHQYRWLGFFLGLPLALFVSLNFGPYVPWVNPAVTLLSLFALTSGAAVTPGLLIQAFIPLRDTQGEG
jgi:hypothetical protein